VTCQSARPTPPVWLSPVRQLAAMLRGYLNSSDHDVCRGAGSDAGRLISLGSSISAQASERRASSSRPLPMSQRGDSGTQTRIPPRLLPRPAAGGLVVA
jgi:hypothetical protein